MSFVEVETFHSKGPEAGHISILWCPILRPLTLEYKNGVVDINLTTTIVSCELLLKQHAIVSGKCSQQLIFGSYTQKSGLNYLLRWLNEFKNFTSLIHKQVHNKQETNTAKRWRMTETFVNISHGDQVRDWNQIQDLQSTSLSVTTELSDPLDEPQWTTLWKEFFPFSRNAPRSSKIAASIWTPSVPS